MIVLTRRAGAIKPQGPADLDPHHWLTPHLVFAAFFTEAGGAPFDLVTRLRGEINGAAAWDADPFFSGIGVDFSSAGSFLQWDDDDRHDVTGDVTVMWSGAFDVNQDSTLIGKFASGGSGGTTTPFALQRQTSGGTSRITFNRAGSGNPDFRVWASGISSATAAPMVLAATQTGANNVAPLFYSDGVFDTTTPSNWFGGDSFTVASSSAGIRMGYRPDAVQQFDGRVAFAWVASRILTEDEIRELSLRPYQLLAPRVQRLYSVLSIPQTINLGLASETDSALAMTHSKARTLGMATETDLALAVSIAKSLGLGLASETDSALAMTAHRLYALGLAEEADTAFSVAIAKSLGLGLATETDTALALAAARLYALGLATETDSAFSLTHAKTVHLGLATEIDSAMGITTSLDAGSVPKRPGPLVRVGGLMH